MEGEMNEHKDGDKAEDQLVPVDSCQRYTKAQNTLDTQTHKNKA